MEGIISNRCEREIEREAVVGSASRELGELPTGLVLLKKAQAPRETQPGMAVVHAANT